MRGQKRTKERNTDGKKETKEQRKNRREERDGQKESRTEEELEEEDEGGKKKEGPTCTTSLHLKASGCFASTPTLFL